MRSGISHINIVSDSFFLSNFFVLILKQVQHRYKEATLRPFDSSTSSPLRARLPNTLVKTSTR
jgi:hypothetical protein